MFVVLDANVLVSAFWSRDSNPARIVSLALNSIITPCFDSRIMNEYRGVLYRKKFGFEKWEINQVLAQLENDGLSVVPVPLSIRFVDESDKKFYEIAKHCNAPLVTGNIRHYPRDPLVVTPADFLAAFKE